ncbi:MAG TPA: PhzF family phenazine biosynthesis protein [Methylomirabilota bacterium]|nr:PhzF family phenazine biosynthesis protein [Methylomirabilota bacterium]
MPKRYDYVTVDVFTDRAFAGNPLAVVIDAAGLDTAQMQAIAAEFNYSESTFVLPPENPSHTARVRIFTRQNEIPFAGHPNVGTAFVLGRLAERKGAPLGATVRFEEAAGLVPVDLERDGAGHVVGATLTAPQPLALDQTIPAAVIAECVGLEAAAVLTGSHEPVVASVGLPFVLAEVAADAIGRAVSDAVATASAARRYAFRSGRFSVHIYARTPGRADGADLRARMFSPLGGTGEDPATGSANGALIALLATLDPAADTVLALDVLQGAEMGRPSYLRVTAEKQAGAVTRVRVGGRCAPVMEGALTV